MSLRAKLEAIIYAADEPVTLDQMLPVLREDLLASQSQAADAELNLIASDDTMPRVAIDEAAVTDGVAPEGIAVDGIALNGVAPNKDDKAEKKALKERLRREVEQLVSEYAASERGMEIRQIAGGYRISTKPEHHDAVRAFVKSLKPPIRLSLQALETLAVIAYRQPVTAPEISEIRGVDSSGVLAGLLDRKLITTSGRKQVIGRPILYKTTKDFLLRFGLKDIAELPSMEEFEKITSGQTDLFPEPQDAAIPDATGVPDEPLDAHPEEASDSEAEEPGASTVSTEAPTEISADGADAQGPDVQSSDVQSSDVQSPDIQGSDIQTSDIQTSEVESSETESFETPGSKMQHPETHGSETQDSERQSSEAQPANDQITESK